jgi:hypothetical protein
VEAFVRESDTSDKPYQRVVASLLASPHFGERVAMWWLDAARYADTDGFQADAERANWPWRDWVISAFNANMPFDQFTIEQHAGDLLPNPTEEQIIATAFHRNTMTNSEGGTDPVARRPSDRVNTIGTTWLGLTLGCTQCHCSSTPSSQTDYYSLTAFNSIDEDGGGGSGRSRSSPIVASGRAPSRGAAARRSAPSAEALTRAKRRTFCHWLTAAWPVRGGFPLAYSGDGLGHQHGLAQDADVVRTSGRAIRTTIASAPA